MPAACVEKALFAVTPVESAAERASCVFVHELNG